MSAIKLKRKAKSVRNQVAVHRADYDSSHVRGMSPTSRGPVSTFYSAGPVLSLKSLVQPKLTIGQPNDRYEREADRVADQVIRMPEPKGSLVQRQSTCPECPEKEEIQTKPVAEQITPLVQRQEEGPEEEEETPMQAKPLSGKSSQVTPGLQGQIQSIRGGGQPLPQSTRAFFEPRFGRDFSRMRVHTGSQAAEATKSLNARAFTMGKDMVFGTHQYSPGTSMGRRLLAHELTHVIQQGANSTKYKTNIIQRSTCPSSCVGPVSKGAICRASKVTRDNCAESGPISDSNKISHIRVLAKSKKVHLFWNGSPKTAKGTKEIHDCNPGKSSTPTPSGWDKVGVKCGVKHTSWKRYNMAWFTAFRSTGYAVGFHDSQPLSGKGSHGCVRVSCEVAKKINENSKSKWTSIMVR